jgi:alpha-tubulin suppressor-like RCC1 family protein
MKTAVFTGLAIAAFGLPVSVRAQSAPYAHTQAAGPISSTNATLNGMVVPNGNDTVAWFEWGTNNTYGGVTAAVNVGDRPSVVRISAVISNLPPLSVFRCRLMASNSLGLVSAAPVLFTTGQRVTQWGGTSDGQMPVAAGLSNTVAISGGHFHSLALTADGRVVAWGQNSAGQSLVPAGLGNVMAVSAGGYFNVVLHTDGTLQAWGENVVGQTNVPAGLSNVVAVSAGYNHTLALTADGLVVAWGENTGGQTTVPAGLSNVVEVAAGGFHSLALKADGTVAAWGEGYAGHTTVPPGLTNVVRVSTGRTSFGIKADGTLVSWPIDELMSADLAPVVDAEGGIFYSLALRTDGTVTAWGIDYVGLTNVPPGLSNVVAIAGAGYHSLALGNLPPEAKGQHLSGVAGQDLIIQLTAADLNSDALSFHITTLPASGRLYQWTPGGRGTAITVSGALVEDPGARVILEQPAAANDLFEFLVNDGLVDSTPATVLVDSVPARAFTRRTQPAGTNSVKLCGHVLAATPTEAWFEWGAFGSYGQVTAPVSLAGDGSLVFVTTLVTNLADLANFQCRLVVSNEFGASYGMPVLFTTGRRVYAWGNNNSGQTNVPPTLTNAVFAACGWHNSLAIRADGTPVGWGWAGSPYASPPEGLSNVVDLAGGYNHNLALKADGTVVAWGSNNAGQTNVPAGLSDVVDVVAGYSHSMALRADGTLALWGVITTTGQLAPPPDLSNVVDFATAFVFDVALKADGTVVAWGMDNGTGGTYIPAGLMNVVALAVGDDGHCVALKSDGTVVAWGRNSAGQAAVPPGLSNVIAVAAGSDQSLALKADGGVVAWGRITTVKGNNVVPGLTNVVLLAAGSSHGLALGNLPPHAPQINESGLAGADSVLTLRGVDPDGDLLRYRVTSLPTTGSLYQWTPGGRGSVIAAHDTWVEDPGGRLIYAHPGPASVVFTYAASDGLVDSTNAIVTVTISPAWVSTQPTRPAGAFASVLCGTFAAASPTTAWFEWGTAGGYGQVTAPQDFVGDGKLTRATALVTNLVPRVNYQFRLVSSNAFGVCHGAPLLFTTGRKVVAWGRNNYGQTNVPMALGNAVSVAAGVNHNLALGANGTVAAWGLSANGETNMPPDVGDVVAVDAGANHSLVLQSDGTVVSWGLGSRGQTNVPPGLSNVVGIAAGYYHNLALSADGTVVAWGDNYFDQLLGGQTNVPLGLSNVVSVAAGGGHNLALKADGTVVAWGHNSSRQTNVPAGLTNLVAVAAGRSHSLALQANGTVVAWGNARGGQTSVPASATNVVALAGGESHSLALRADGIVVAWGDGYYGQTMIPAGLGNVAALSGGGFHNLALANLPPRAQNQTNVAFVAQALTVVLPAGDPDDDPLAFRVTSMPAAGTLYQWTLNGRGPAITEAGGVVADSLGRVIFAPGSGTEAWPYATFDFIANDGEADSTPATITLNLMPMLIIDVTSVTMDTNAGFSLSFSGSTNATYRVWVSTNLTTWDVLGPPSQPVPGVFSFTEAETTNWPQRFYRLSSP